MGKADQFCCACASCEVNLSLETHSSQSRAAVLTALLSVKSSTSLLSRSQPNLGKCLLILQIFNVQDLLSSCIRQQLLCCSALSLSTHNPPSLSLLVVCCSPDRLLFPHQWSIIIWCQCLNWGKCVNASKMLLVTACHPQLQSPFSPL